MLSLQEIQSVNFEKAVFGGYDMKSVDLFMEQLTEDYAALQKENAALKAKMKVLVDKIEEYRSVEDGMRKALLSAQNIAAEMVEKAKGESSQIMEAAKTEAENRIAQFRAQLREEEGRLVAAQKQSEEFIARMTAYYQAEIGNLTQVSAGNMRLAEQAAMPKIEPPAAAQQEPAQRELEKTKEMEEIPVSLPDDIAEMFTAAKKSIAEPSVVPQVTVTPKQEPAASAPGDDSMKMKVFEVTLGGSRRTKEVESSSAVAAADSMASKYDLGNLRFGKAYSPDDDK